MKIALTGSPRNTDTGGIRALSFPTGGTRSPTHNDRDADPDYSGPIVLNARTTSQVCTPSCSTTVHDVPYSLLYLLDLYLDTWTASYSFAAGQLSSSRCASRERSPSTQSMAISAADAFFQPPRQLYDKHHDELLSGARTTSYTFRPALDLCKDSQPHRLPSFSSTR